MTIPNGFRKHRVTLGVQGLIVDAEKRVLLIRHSYRPGWHFPGGGVERNEPIDEALKRELREEAGVILRTAPKLVGVYSHFDEFPGDHILLFLVEDWHQPSVPAPNGEIAEQQMFSLDRLPVDIAEASARRISEVLLGAPKSATW